MAAWRSTREMKSPRLSRRRVSAEKKPSTAFSHEAEVGVKWNTQRGWRESQARTLGCLLDGIVVHDRVHQLAGRDCRLNGVEKADEFLMTVALHAAAQHRAVEYVQGRKQRGRPMPLVIMRHGRGATGPDGQPFRR